MTHERPSLPEQGKIVEKVNSVAELLPALKAGAKAAIYEASPVPKELNFTLFAETLSTYNQVRAFMPRMPDGHPTGISARLGYTILKEFQSKRQVLDRLVRFRSPEEKTKFFAVAEFIANDIAELLQNFSGYEVHFNDVDLRVQTGRAEQEMHPDDAGFNTSPDLEKIRIVRVYQGPSTIYSRSTKRGPYIQGRDGSISAHTTGKDGALHMPPNVHGSVRVAVVLSLSKTY